MHIRPHLRSFLAVMIEVSVFLSVARVTVAQSGSASTASKQSEAAQTAGRTAMQSIIVYCPIQQQGPVPPTKEKAGPVPERKPGGPHKVTLSWNASIVTPNRSAAIGYCLYRARQIDGTKQNPVFGALERINLVSVPGTSCVDESVQNGDTYRYIVTAVNSSRNPSLPSNEVFATIPSEPPIASSVGSSEPISCSEPSPQTPGQATTHDQ